MLLRRGVLVFAALAVVLVGCSSDDGPSSGPLRSVEAEGDGVGAASTTAAPATTTSPAPAVDLVGAACDGTLVATPGAKVQGEGVTEASGIAPDGDETWVVNDSGDQPRLYGIDAEGAARVVAVTGAEAVDWEDLARVGGDDPHLWIADTGGNIEARTTVQLYRVPVPGPDDTEVAAERVDVTYPDGGHDVEGVLADPEGPLYLLTKEPARSQVFRVDPPAGGGAVDAVRVGEFRPGEGPASTVTSAALAPDRSAIAVRTYGGAFLHPLAEGQDVADALADASARCRTPTGLEVQGESIGFLADATGYVTIGEGTNPTITTIAPQG